MFSLFKKRKLSDGLPRRIYCDYAAATPVMPGVGTIIESALAIYGNPGALYREGEEAKETLNTARAKIASVLSVKPNEVIFTSSATESNNLAIIGYIRSLNENSIRPHIISTSIEHSSVSEVLVSDEVQSGADVTCISPNEKGGITEEELRKALTPRTRLVSIGWANGEIGTIQKIRTLSQVIREYEKQHSIRICFHTDAGQAPWALSPQPHGIGVDMMTLSPSKHYGPRGIALLYVHHSIQLSTLLYGGKQEFGLRPGTEDTALAAACAYSTEQFERARENEFHRLSQLRALFISLVREEIPSVVVNGDAPQHLPHLVNISIKNIDSEYIVLALDARGIACSTKSICLLESGDPISPVVAALVHNNKHDSWRSTTTLRFSFGIATTEKDIRIVVTTLAELVAAYRAM
jgi:cysteine desulfurase